MHVYTIYHTRDTYTRGSLSMVSSGLVALHLAYTTFYYGIFIHLVYVYELWRNRQTIVNAHCLSFSFGNVSVVVNKIAKNICMTKHVRKKKHDFRKKSKQKIEKKNKRFSSHTRITIMIMHFDQVCKTFPTIFLLN